MVAVSWRQWTQQIIAFCGVFVAAPVAGEEPAFDRSLSTPGSRFLIDEPASPGPALLLFGDSLPFEIEASLVLDGSQRISGGRPGRRNVVRNLFELSLSAPTEPLIGWEGGSFQVTFQNQAGRNGSDMIGDLQGFSNIDSDGRTQISEVWIRQTFGDGRWRLRIGKIDANSQFAFVEHGQAFLNSSMGVSPTIFTMPTYPNPAFGATAFFQPDMGFYAGLGLFDGAGVLGIPTGSRGLDSLLQGSRFFLIGETGLRWDLATDAEPGEPQFPGRLGVGAWHHNGSFARFDGSLQSGTGGLFVVLDQLVLRESLDETGQQGVGVFAQYGSSHPDVSAIEHHLGAGATVTGLVPRRDADRMGLGLSLALLSDQAGAAFHDDFELAAELFYEAHLCDRASLVLDLQHITNPGGDDTKPDAVVGTVRFVLTGALSDVFTP